MIGRKWAMAMLAFKSAMSAVIFFAMLTTIVTIGPSVETRWFPVVGKLQVISAVQNSDDYTVVHAAFRKMRDCEYIGIQWFVGVGADGEFSRVPVELLREATDTTSPNRPIGFQQAGPWVIHLPLEQFKNNSFATLTHRCNPFWMTTTNFYP